MTQDFGKTTEAKTPGRRPISAGALIVVVVIVGALGYEAYKWHTAWSGTGTARNVGTHIYSQLQAVEPDVLSGKIKDPNDPRLSAIENEISSYGNSRHNQSFDDSMLLAGLTQYQAALGSIAMSNSAPSSSVGRGRDLMLLKQEKTEIEKYLN